MEKQQEALDRELIDAAHAGNADRSRGLLASSANVNAKETTGWTALMQAAENGHLNVVRILIESGADVNGTDKYGWTALTSAAENGHAGTTRILTERGADVNSMTTDGASALILAARYGHVDIVQFLAERGADINAKDRSGWTPLAWAAANGHLDIVCFLTERGADVNVTARDGSTVLIWAAASNRADVVRYLVANGANASATNRLGNTAFRISAHSGHQEIVHVLAPLEKTSQRQLSQHISHVGTAPPSHPSCHIISPLEVEMTQFIDKGNFGGDYRAKWLDADVVIKLFVPGASTSTFADEVHLWKQLRHPNVIELYGACDDGNLQLFVCEYASNGSLDVYLKSCDAERRTPWKYLYQAALGLEFFHERKIIHGDLRCRNILVGSDGLVKLANFELSTSHRMATHDNSMRMLADSMRWQSPERLRGEETSFASDVYSLGICIVEAVTGDTPWGDKVDYWVVEFKRSWRPEDDREADENKPPGLDGEALALVQHMCCHDPGKRMNIRSVVYELECLADKEDVMVQGRSTNTRTDTLFTIDTYKNGEVAMLWVVIETFFAEHENLTHLRQQFKGLRELYHRLQMDKQPQTVLQRFGEVLADFHTSIKTLAFGGHAQIMLLSATRTTNRSIHAFHRRIELVWRMLDDSTHAAREQDECWAQQHSHQIELFVSKVSNYSKGQLEVVQKAYDEIASRVGATTLAASTPEWFIPWYELQRDQGSDCLGNGSIGSVHRAKWLSSGVVVKQVEFHVNRSSSAGSSWKSRSQSTAKTASTSDSSSNMMRAKTIEMFKREADNWFGLSHPHVVRLFGACHVGSPFFVCEYATNGTLVEYLRRHPDQLWRLLHEAALGVQYLHERGIVHGDLKGNNIVVGSDKKAKVTDFGLSSIMSASSESSAQITGAWHWEAPECILGKGTRPTFAADVFSLGMCVIEALRVVDSLQYGSDSPAPAVVPWGDLENAAVKVHLSRGNLPTRPAGCSYDEWTLVTRMCCHDPDKRLKISTVVDELAELRSSAAEESVSEVKKLDGKSVLKTMQLPEALSAMKKLMKTLCGNGMTRFSRKLKKNLLGRVDGRVKICHLYLSLWKRIELVHAHIISSQKVGSRDEKLCLIVEEARVRTLDLPDLNHTLREMTEATLHGYALHRHLDKFIGANLMCATETKWSSFRSWQKAASVSSP